ncbi:hypothetical protein ABZ532_00460 [Streptomyces sp. NPDC019396]|uniref:hypothetical protein n=1 Tax=Streptomyces sp. NPDC019396 TaxID=3154687 RepID=UPI00340903F2
MRNLTVLQGSDTALYLTGGVVSGFGATAMWLVSGIWVKSLTDSDGPAALAVFALWAPALAGPWLGSVADRVRRRPLVVAVAAAMALLLPCLVLVGSAGRVWLLFCVLVVYGAGGVIAEAAESAHALDGPGAPGESGSRGIRMTDPVGSGHHSGHAETFRIPLRAAW